VYYQGGLLLALLLVLAQFWVARHRGRGECFVAFRANQWVGLAVFAGIAAHYSLG
jgi:4-hydroxybenzoate polyprenyltransferase